MNKEKSFLSLGYCKGTNVDLLFMTLLQRGIRVSGLQTNIQVPVTKYCQFYPTCFASNTTFSSLFLFTTEQHDLSSFATVTNCNAGIIGKV